MDAYEQRAAPVACASDPSTVTQAAARSKRACRARPGCQARAATCSSGLLGVLRADPGVPAVVEHEPREQPVPGLPGVTAVTGREVGQPLLVRTQRLERLGVGDPAPPAHVRERSAQLAERSLVDTRSEEHTSELQ